MSVPTYLDWVERYAKLGIKVFPVDAQTKAPLCKHGFYDATTDIEQIRAWWSMWPKACIAAPTGLINGFFAYDIDPRNGGKQSHDQLTEGKPPFAPTPRFNSGGGGHQVLFAYPPHKLPSRVGLRPGLDIKSDGGYTILPPSLHKSGNSYRWIKDNDINKPAFDQAPDWLLTVITESNRPGWDGKKEAVCADDLCYPEGTRENSLVSLIGTMNRRGMSKAAITAAMQSENESKCKPPLPKDEIEGLVTRQLEQYKPDPDFVMGVSKDTYEPLGWPTRSPLVGVSSPDAGRVEELISSLLGKGTVTVLAATWKSGKTLLTYRLILDALRGNPAYGIFHTIKPLKVMMLQFEMPLPEDERRYRRLAIGSNLDPAGVTEFSNMGRLYHYNRPQISLTEPADLQRFHSLVFGGGFDLVVVDSVMAAFAGVDMNDNTRVRKLYQDTFLPLTTNGVSVLLLHHKRKGGQRKKGDPPDDPKASMLGAQAWGAASDRIFLLEPIEEANKSPGSFKVRLSLAGGWAPSGFERVVLQIEDDGEGTKIEPISDDTLKAMNRTEQGAKDLYAHVKTNDRVSWQEAQAYLKGEDYSRNETAKARDLAVQRGWIATESRANQKDPLVYFCPPNPLESAS